MKTASQHRSEICLKSLVSTSNHFEASRSARHTYDYNRCGFDSRSRKCIFHFHRFGNEAKPSEFGEKRGREMS